MIYLMRHGQSVVNLERRLTCKKYDGELTALGREQAEKAGRWLMGKEISSIYCSPFHRAQETAQIVGRHLKLTPVTLDGLREMDCGSLEGRTDEEAWGMWAKVYERWLAADWEAAYPDGETYRTAHDRYQQALKQAPFDGHALFVSHGGITRTVAPYLCVNASALQQIGDLHNTGMVVLESYDANRYSCLSWNLIEHLNTEDKSF
jgi:broad specificity phosphatase PhoE